ncbi:hypothetical protein ACFPDQ_03290 [Pseudofrancisella aestuarii]|uniref:Uncharacterized protein n=1 Tax=Pseudofrancisella aestuarii TaxID=2670347 RepID=A0ABV9TBB2_9GAMM|nr:hypothetical protein [Pseudofrancisella aestuarii]
MSSKILKKTLKISILLLSLSLASCGKKVEKAKVEDVSLKIVYDKNIHIPTDSNIKHTTDKYIFISGNNNSYIIDKKSLSISKIAENGSVQYVEENKESGDILVIFYNNSNYSTKSGILIKKDGSINKLQFSGDVLLDRDKKYSVIKSKNIDFIVPHNNDSKIDIIYTDGKISSLNPDNSKAKLNQVCSLSEKVVLSFYNSSSILILSSDGSSAVKPMKNSSAINLICNDERVLAYDKYNQGNILIDNKGNITSFPMGIKKLSSTTYFNPSSGNVIIQYDDNKKLSAINKDGRYRNIPEKEIATNSQYIKAYNNSSSGNIILEDENQNIILFDQNLNYSLIPSLATSRNRNVTIYDNLLSGNILIYYRNSSRLQLIKPAGEIQEIRSPEGQKIDHIYYNDNANLVIVKYENTDKATLIYKDGKTYTASINDYIYADSDYHPYNGIYENKESKITFVKTSSKTYFFDNDGKEQTIPDSFDSISFAAGRTILKSNNVIYIINPKGEIKKIENPQPKKLLFDKIYYNSGSNIIITFQSYYITNKDKISIILVVDEKENIKTINNEDFAHIDKVFQSKKSKNTLLIAGKEDFDAYTDLIRKVYSINENAELVNLPLASGKVIDDSFYSTGLDKLFLSFKFAPNLEIIDLPNLTAEAISEVLDNNSSTNLTNEGLASNHYAVKYGDNSLYVFDSQHIYKPALKKDTGPSDIQYLPNNDISVSIDNHDLLLVTKNNDFIYIPTE